MTEVIQSSPNHPFPSPSSSSTTSTSPRAHNDNHHPLSLINNNNINNGDSSEEEEEEDSEGDQLSLLTLIVAAFRKSLIGCSVATTTITNNSNNNTSSSSSSSSKQEIIGQMEIGLPSNVRHVAHVTFDRFNGFLGLPVEFEPEVPMRAPSASATVFGVSTDSMQLSFDSRGNCVPTILLLMQRQLYAQGGLQAEGIFRINAENSQEEYVRDQLNRGIVPTSIDMHCLAGLIKAWFRELPTGVLDLIPPEQVMQAQTEEECAQLASLLPPMESALLDWAINLMADVAQLEHLNKMNARNVAMVFAPNMTQMADPLTALMHAVQVMNFLKTLIVKTLREREDSVVESIPIPRLKPSDDNGHQSSSSQPHLEADDKEQEDENDFVSDEPTLEDDSISESRRQNLTSIENIISAGNRTLVDNCPCEVVTSGRQDDNFTPGGRKIQTKVCKSRTGQLGSNLKKLNHGGKGFWRPSRGGRPTSRWSWKSYVFSFSSGNSLHNVPQVLEIAWRRKKSSLLFAPSAAIQTEPADA
ncbi:hypothetical protein ACFE04_003265 [Oxalis oulophora]